MQQPPYNNPPQGPSYYPSPAQQPPPKKRFTGWIIGLLILSVALFACVATTSHNGNPSPSITTANIGTTQPQATPSPTKPLAWVTTQTFSGNGSKKTGTFAVPDDWKIKWTCNPSSFSGMGYNVMVDVDNSDGTSADLGAINSMCQSGSTSGDTEEHQSGTVFLDITSEGDWTFTIQELK